MAGTCLSVSDSLSVLHISVLLFFPYSSDAKLTPGLKAYTFKTHRAPSPITDTVVSRNRDNRTQNPEITVYLQKLGLRASGLI